MEQAELNALIAQFIAEWGYSGDAENVEFEQAVRALIANCGLLPPPVERDANQTHRPKRAYRL